MTDKQLIGKIRQLRQIKPRKEWVFLTKNQILGEHGGLSSVPSVQDRVLNIFSQLFFSPARTVLVSLTTFVFILFGLLGFAQNSLPGDLLYPIKKITEKGQAIFVSEKEKPRTQLELTGKRLEELAKIAENNQTQKLPTALEEVKTTKNIAKKELSKAIEKKSKSEVLKIAKEIAPKLMEIEEKEKKVYSSLGIEPPKEENNEPAEKMIVELLIQDLKNSSLTETQETFLVQAEEYYQNGDYISALEKILQISEK